MFVLPLFIISYMVSIHIDRKEAISETEDILSSDHQNELTTCDVKEETDMDSYKVPATSVTQASGSVQTSGKSVPKWFKMCK